MARLNENGRLILRSGDCVKDYRTGRALGGPLLDVSIKRVGQILIFSSEDRKVAALVNGNPLEAVSKKLSKEIARYTIYPRAPRKRCCFCEQYQGPVNHLDGQGGCHLVAGVKMGWAACRNFLPRMDDDD